MQCLCALVSLLVVGLSASRAGDDGFKPLFNGKDLTGWHNVNSARGADWLANCGHFPIGTLAD